MVKMKEKIKKLIKNNNAVSTIVGYALTLAMCAMILSSSVLIITQIVQNRSDAAARVEAQIIANRVVDIIIEAAEFSQEMEEDAIYERVMQLPDRIGNYDYYVEATNDAIYVKTYNGRISEKCTTYLLMESLGETPVYGITGKVHSGTPILITIDTMQ
jgi:hypothetical protein